MSGEVVLKVRDVAVEFKSAMGAVRALDGVSLDVSRGEIVAVVGESGCGKTTLARAILGLQPIVSGTIQVAGEEVHGTARAQAKRVGMVWQDPFASLDPRWSVTRSLTEPVRLVGERANTATLLSEVGLDDRFASRYPHQLSGGQRQRVAIGRALALRPPLVICDEPTAALDLSIQAQILNLIKDIREASGNAFLYISHDLTTVRFLADRIAVMYMGRIVEVGPTESVFESPKHPYTLALMESAPSLDRIGKLPEPLEGELPDPHTRFAGCRFASRCRFSQPRCLEDDPALRPVADRDVACHFPVNIS